MLTIEGLDRAIGSFCRGIGHSSEGARTAGSGRELPILIVYLDGCFPPLPPTTGQPAHGPKIAGANGQHHVARHVGPIPVKLSVVTPPAMCRT